MKLQNEICMKRAGGGRYNEIGLLSVQRVLKIEHPDDWYRADPKVIRKKIRRFGLPLVDLLQTLHPEYRWKPWLFHPSLLSREFWNDDSNRRVFFDWLGSQ